MRIIAARFAHGAVVPAELAPETAPERVQSAASRLARAGERSARREAAADVVLLTVLGLGMAVRAPAGPLPGFSIRSAIVLVVITMVVFAASSVFATVQRANPPLLEEARRIALSALGAVGIWFVVSSHAFDQRLDRRTGNMLLLWLTLATISTLTVQRAARTIARRADPERILILGAGEIGQALARRIGASGSSHGRVVGFYDGHPLPLHQSLDGIPAFDEETPLAAVIDRTGATRLLIAFSHLSADEVLETIRSSRFGAIPVSVVPRYFELTPSHARISDLGGIPILNLHSARLSRGARSAKRVLDVCVAGAGLLALVPVFAVIAAAIKLDSPGPVFFRQFRTGQNGRTFRIWKFRTMVTDAEARRHEIAHLNEMVASGPLFKMRCDPRVTGIGRFLRRSSLDELPQLWNVVLGNMSLVGPRPFVGHEAAQMSGWSARRLDLAPGMTGLWQVRGRNAVPYDEMIRLDYLYVTTWSIWWDLKILFHTIPQVVRGAGAS